MKKTILIALAAITLLAGSNARAQSFQDINWGVIGGLNVSHVTFDLGVDNLVGFHAGVIGELPFFRDDMYLLGGALISEQGCSFDDERFPITYLNIPLHLGIKLPLTDVLTGFVDAGAFAAYAVAFDDDDWDSDRRFDLGFGVRGGIGYGDHLRFSVGYDLGAISLDEDINVKNRNLMFSVAYMF